MLAAHFALSMSAFAAPVETVPVAKPDVASKLWASLSAPVPVAEEHGAEAVLSLALVNDGAFAVHAEALLRGSRLFINGQAVENWPPLPLRDDFGTPPPLEPGRAFTRAQEMGFYLSRAGTYRVRWVGVGYESPEITLRVLPPREPLDSRRGSAVALLQEIRRDLPPGWRAFYDASKSRISVMRMAPLRMARPLFAHGARAQRKSRDPLAQFTLALNLLDFVSPEKHAVLRRDNARIRAEMKALAATMKNWGHKVQSLPAEKEKAARYKRLEESLHHLPDFAFRDISLSWHQPFYAPLPEQQFQGVTNESEKAECRTATLKIIGLLTRYVPTPAPRQG
jgi:hypothetical protein